MNSRSIRLGTMTLIFAVLAISSGAAADLTAFIGGVKPGSLSVNSIKTPLSSSPVFGVRLSSDFIPLLGHEHTLAFSSDYLIPQGIRDITQARGFVYSSNLLLNLRIGKAVPYATAGLGLIHQYGDKNLPVGTRFAVNYGGGVKFPKLAGPLGVRFDARGYTATGISGGSLNMVELTAGLLISFGR